LIPVSMLVMQPMNVGSWVFAALGAGACLPQLKSSARFLAQRDDQRARVLLRASLVYLPAILLLVVIRWVVL